MTNAGEPAFVISEKIGRCKMGSEYAVEMKNITKRFGGLIAVDNVSLQIKSGEIHALCGENGAGKSTTIKLMTVNIPPN